VKQKWIVILIVFLTAGVLPAAPRYIGVVTADGSFWVDNTGVSNHATVFEGSTIETQEASAKLQMAGGARILLDARSRAQVYPDHLVLEKGRSQLDSAAGYRIEARSLRISPVSLESRAIVAMRDAVVEVGALAGDVQVKNAQQIAVAQLSPAQSVELRPDQGASASVLTGCVSKMGKTYVLKDEVSGVTMELRGPELSRNMGKRIQITGQTAASRDATIADEVLQASEIKVLGTGCGTTLTALSKVAAKGSRERAAPLAGSGGAAASASTGTMVSAGSSVPTALIAGVAVAAGTGSVTGVVAARKKPKPPISPGR